MNDVEQTEVKLGNISTKFSDSDHEIQKTSEALLNQMNELHSKLYVGLNSIDAKKVLEGDTSTDESLDSQVLSKAQQTDSFSTTGSSMIYAIAGFVVGAITGLFIVQIIRKKTAKSGNVLKKKLIAAERGGSQKLS